MKLARRSVSLGSLLIFACLPGCHRGATPSGTLMSGAVPITAESASNSGAGTGNACGDDPHACAPSPSPAPASPAPALKLGATMTLSKTVPLRDVAKDPTHYASQPVRTEGTVSAVCQSMGCWMEIRDDRSAAHIRMHGHAFFVPKTASGRHAVVEGTVLAKPANGECEREAEGVTGKPVTVELDATGIELL